MNKNILIASVFFAGAAALYYTLKRRFNTMEPVEHIPGEHPRHLINVFSKAKQSLQHDNGMHAPKMGIK